MHCIFAYTPAEGYYPPYFNVSELAGEIQITVRAPKQEPTDERPYPDAGVTASIVLPPEQLEALYKSLFVEMIRLVQKGAI